MTTKLTVLLGFVVAFSAGLLTGLNSRPQAPVNSVPSTTYPSNFQGRRGDRDRDGFLARELGLTPEQRDQMKEIWSSVATRGRREQDELRRQYRDERDEAIAALIHTTDLQAYDAILKQHQAKLAAMDQEFSSAWEAAVERTKGILTPEQRTKYEEFVKRNQRWEGGPRGGRGGPPGPPPGPGFDDEPHHAGDRATSRQMDR
jgi:Spy/CpxP family protein refolding chaperone